MNESYWKTQQRIQHEQRQAEIKAIIDGLSDEDLHDHALRYSAGSPNLLWTVSLNPRTAPGIRSAIAVRVEMGIGPRELRTHYKDDEGRWWPKPITQDVLDMARAHKQAAGQRSPGDRSIFTTVLQGGRK